MVKSPDNKTIGSFGGALFINILLVFGTAGISYLLPQTGGVVFIGHVLGSFFFGIILILIGEKYSAIGKGILLSSILVLLVGFSLCLATPIISH